MKITGYTIIYFLLNILLLYGFIKFEIWVYNKFWISEHPDHFGIIAMHIIIITIIICVLGVTGKLDKLDKLLKKRIL